MSNLRFEFHYSSPETLSALAHIRTKEPIWKKCYSSPIKGINQAFVQPIEPTVLNILSIENVLMYATYPFRYTDVSSLGEYAGNVYRFLLSLDAYKESSNPIMDINFILRNAHDPSFAKKLKQIRLEAISKKFNCTFLEYSEGFNKNSPYDFKDIGDIFNYAYLPHFIEENEDYKKSFLPLEQNPKWLRKFRKMANYILSDLKMPDIKKIDVLKDRASSSFFEGNCIPQWQIPQKKSQQFSEKRKPAKRTVIQVSPENSRDALILDPADLNTVSLIELTVMEILELNFKRFIPGRDNNAFIRKYNKRIKKYNLYYMRDIEKEGLTRPRNLITIILEEFHKLYPDIDAFQYPDFFSENPFYLDGELVHPTRGTGLGFCNSLVSIMQIIVWALIERNIITENEEGNSIECDFLVLNDDIIGFFQNEDELEFFKDSEIEVFEGLGLIRKESKSFHSPVGGVLCETYFYRQSFEISKKESYLRRNALLAFSAQNVTHAKSMIDRSNIYTLDYIREIQLYWGYEFSKNEYTWPSSFGGWISEIYKSISLFEFVKDDMIIDDGLGAAYVASQVVVKKTRTISKKFSHRFLFLDPELRYYINTELGELFKIDLRISELEDLYTRIRFSRDLFTRYWNLMMTLRQKLFNKYYRRYYLNSFEEYYHHCKEDILPTNEGDCFYETYEGKTLPDPFVSSTKFRSIEKYMNRDYEGNTLCSKFCALSISDGSYYTPSKEHSMMVQNFLSVSKTMEGKHAAFLVPEEYSRKILRVQSYIEVALEFDIFFPDFPLNKGERRELELRNMELPCYDDFIFKAYLFNWINQNELLYYLQGDEYLKKAIRKDLKSIRRKRIRDKIERKRKKESSSDSDQDRGDDAAAVLLSYQTDPRIQELLRQITNVREKPEKEPEPPPEIEEPIEEYEPEHNLPDYKEYKRIYDLNSSYNVKIRGTYLFVDGFELDVKARSYYNGAVFPEQMPTKVVELTPAFLYDLESNQIKEDDVYPFDRNFRIYLAGVALSRIGQVGRSSDLSHLKTADDWGGYALGFSKDDIPEIESYFQNPELENEDQPLDFGDW